MFNVQTIANTFWDLSSRIYMYIYIYLQPNGNFGYIMNGFMNSLYYWEYTGLVDDKEDKESNGRGDENFAKNAEDDEYDDMIVLDQIVFFCCCCYFLKYDLDKYKIGLNILCEIFLCQYLKRIKVAKILPNKNICHLHSLVQIRKEKEISWFDIIECLDKPKQTEPKKFYMKFRVQWK